MKHQNTSALTVAVTMLLLGVLLCTYGAGYYLRDQSGGIGPIAGIQYRIYPTQWEAVLFFPAAKVESLVTGVLISTGYSA